jgi:NAD(P)-dependent dehydrogenase (short-subunit alcohol dehydrogenase family)
VRAFADAFLKRGGGGGGGGGEGGGELHVLVNNAGALFPKREVVDVWDGVGGGEGGREGEQMLVEKTMATNNLGPFLLTSLLMPTLKATGRKEGSPARVIMVSSRLERGKAAYLDAWMRDPTLTPSEEKKKKEGEGGKEGRGGGVEAGCPPYKPFLAYGASKLANLLMVSRVHA